MTKSGRKRRLHALLLPPLLASPLAAQELTRLDSFYGSSQPTTLCVSADEQRVYVADGATITILDSSVPLHPLPLIAQVPVNASIANLLPDLAPSPLLFVAGGTFGLLKMVTTETSPCDACSLGKPGGCHEVTVLDDDDPTTTAPDDNETSCLDVAILGGQYLVAAFGARGQNELRVYDLATVRAATAAVTPLVRVAIPAHANPLHAGPAHALAVRADTVYVAMGGQGLALVDFSNLTSPVVVQGPVFGPTGNPFPNQPGDVRDVAVVQGHLYAAVDGMGLAEIDLATSWGPGMAVNLMALPDAAGNPRYVYRLDVVATGATTFVLGLACNEQPAMGREAIPYPPWGAMRFDAGPGNLPATPADGAAPSLLVFPGTQSGGVSPANVREYPTAEWQSLRLARTTGALRSYELHDGNVVIRDVENQNTVLAQRPQWKLQGKNPPRIGALLSAPRFLLTAVDHYPLNGPYLTTCVAGCITPLAPPAGTSSNIGVITNFDAQWLDAATPGMSWLLHGSKSAGWWLELFAPNGPCGGKPPTSLSWKLASPPDQYGLVGRLAFMATSTTRGTRTSCCARAPARATG